MMKRVLVAALSAIFLTTIALAPAPAQTPKAATPEAKKSEKGTKKRTLTPGQRAARERQRKCGAEWKEAKAAGKVDKKMKWPQYWSACNKRLKAQGG